MTIRTEAYLLRTLERQGKRRESDQNRSDSKDNQEQQFRSRIHRVRSLLPASRTEVLDVVDQTLDLFVAQVRIGHHGGRYTYRRSATLDHFSRPIISLAFEDR